jgi:transcriptional regulator with XRE-family HTH domain
MVQILTIMARRVVPKPGKNFFLGEWMAVRGVDPKSVADAIDTTEASVSRWVNARRSPRKRYLVALEGFLQVDPGGLSRDPSKAPEAELLAGLDADARTDAKRYIAFLHSRKK